MFQEKKYIRFIDGQPIYGSENLWERGGGVVLQDLFEFFSVFNLLLPISNEW